MESKGAVVSELQLPCGTCDGCRLERSRQWAVRCVHESQMHQENCFITLTYDDDHIPPGGNLRYKDFQNFMKRLRKKYTGKKIRFFMCGEYGNLRERPHYHACLFGIDFGDKLYHKSTAAGSKIYTSNALSSLWTDKDGSPLGFCTVGIVNFDSAGYVARYVMKKRQGKDNREGYEYIDEKTGEIKYKEAEFIHMSLKPGVGHGFYIKYFSDIFPRDTVVINGVEVKTPKYYYKKLKLDNEEVFATIAQKRTETGAKYRKDNTPERLKVKEKVQKARTKMLQRELS